MKRVCAVIPAAGRGSRLGGVVPKVLFPVARGKTIWDLLYDRLSPHVDHIHTVVSPDGMSAFNAHLRNRRARLRPGVGVSSSVQPKPTGMGDAVFRGFPVWGRYENVLVVWGDQVLISDSTVAAVVQKHLAGAPPALTIPLTRPAKPYVEYRFNKEGALIRILQSREGDKCRPRGLADIGLFCMSVPGIRKSWRSYVKSADAGARTGEVNFLPFLAYLSGAQGWRTTKILVADRDEALGINTPEDVRRFKAIMKKRGESHV